VFVKIWRQIETYDNNKGRLFTWMLNIARNASIDAIAELKVEGNFLFTDPLTVAPALCVLD